MRKVFWIKGLGILVLMTGLFLNVFTTAAVWGQEEAIKDPDLVKIKRKLETIKHDFVLQDSSLLNHTDYLKKNYHILINYDLESRKAASGKRTLSFKGLPLGIGLKHLLAQYGLTYVLREKVLWIVKGNGFGEFLTGKSDSERDKQTELILERKLDFPFIEQVLLQQIIDFIKVQLHDTDINIVIDAEEVDAQEELDYFGMGLPIKVALAEMLKKFNGGYMIKDGIVYITSLDVRNIQLARALRTKAGECIQKWAKETDFKELAQRIVQYGKEKGLIVNTKIVGKNHILMPTIERDEEESIFQLAQMLKIEIMSPLLEREVDIKIKAISLQEAFVLFAKDVNYIFPEEPEMAEKRITCRLKNIRRIDALSLIMRSHNYSLLINEKDIKDSQDLWKTKVDIPDVDSYEVESGVIYGNCWDFSGVFSVKVCKTMSPVKWADYYTSLRKKLIYLGDLDEFNEYKIILYQWIIDNADGLSEIYFDIIKKKIDKLPSITLSVAPLRSEEKK